MKNGPLKYVFSNDLDHPVHPCSLTRRCCLPEKAVDPRIVHRVASMDVQADLSLKWAYISFSHVEDQLYLEDPFSKSEIQNISKEKDHYDVRTTKLRSAYSCNPDQPTYL